MKTKNVFVNILALAFVLFVSACSGNKKEASQDHEGNDQMDHAKAEVITPVEVKAFQNVDASIKMQLTMASFIFSLLQSTRCN